MYGPIWRIIPGPKWFKAIVMLVMAGGFIYFLFKVGFPYIQSEFNLMDNTLDV